MSDERSAAPEPGTGDDDGRPDDPIATDADQVGTRDDSPTPDELIATDAGQAGCTAFVPSDNTTMTSVVNGFSERGYGGHFTAEPGSLLRCSGCDAVSPAAEFSVGAVRRLEGASDPDEMIAVVAATCPRCGQAGVAMLGYGPASSEVDADAMVNLPTSRGD